MVRLREEMDSEPVAQIETTEHCLELFHVVVVVVRTMGVDKRQTGPSIDQAL